ncbi:MAG: DUF1292 domain-containing protein [Bacilli bacterium]|nr:DUF1292 domain-containing protein [Bacilli bacterium]
MEEERNLIIDNNEEPVEDDTFIVEDENGKEIEATIITRMQVEDTDLEYLIYSIDDETDTRDVPEEEKQVIIMAARIGQDENGEEILENITDEEEKQAVFEAFSETYKEATAE